MSKSFGHGSDCTDIILLLTKVTIRNDKDAAGKMQSRNIGCTLDQFEDT